ncbi:cell wall-active antibiotics response protein LiaF [Chryseomicrobium sp. FSL W7-1435]|uniref:cell wall-active antibiotics response protein LiaF n=1 Tax=Chryseomicrobium sp. FSL W7-1435 TaxID=2921704 RepID=UPI00315AFDD1
MSKENQTNRYSLLLIGFIALLAAETLLFENGSIVVVIVGFVLIYMGMRRDNRVIFWIGLVLLFLSVFSMVTTRLVLFGIVLYILYKVWKKEPLPSWEQLYLSDDATESSVLQQRMFSTQITSTEPYAWKDVHIQSVFGEYDLDLTNTILPKETCFISIRKVLGKTTVLVPYGVNVRVYYSTIVGEACLFDEPVKRLWNQSYMTEDRIQSDTQTPELIITVASWLGDLEVLRK